VVTAGGTREPIDPVRFIGNRSTGKMGLAVVRAALDRGARVTLLAANIEVALPDDPELTVVRTGSTAELESALGRVATDDSATAGFDALVMAAAVADFRPSAAADRKLPRGDGLTLELESTPDLLAAVAETGRTVQPRPVLVGFAAETGSLERAPDKLRRKGVDLLVANDVAEPGSGFGTDTNRVSILAADGSRIDLPQLTKREVADRILDLVAAALDARDGAAQTGTTRQPASEPA
jgi:phosphopantothenoylcysteine decarboxylase/phosphopantothenate--cysteine ligase